MRERSEYEKAVANWLTNNCPNFPFPCVACGGKEWTVENLVVALYPPIPPIGKVMPLVPLWCRRCGYAVYFSAEMMGLPGPSESP